MRSQRLFTSLTPNKPPTSTPYVVGATTRFQKTALRYPWRRKWPKHGEILLLIWGQEHREISIGKYRCVNINRTPVPDIPHPSREVDSSYYLTTPSLLRRKKNLNSKFTSTGPDFMTFALEILCKVLRKVSSLVDVLSCSANLIRHVYLKNIKFTISFLMKKVRSILTGLRPTCGVPHQ